METSDGHCNIALRKVQESGGGGSGCWLTSDLYLKIDIKVGLFFHGCGISLAKSYQKCYIKDRYQISFPILREFEWNIGNL